MARGWNYGLVAAALTVAALTGGVGQTQAAKTGFTMAGTWKMDPARSTLPGRFGRFGGAGKEHGDWDQARVKGYDESKDGKMGPRGRRGRRLPEVVRITQGNRLIRFSNENGDPVQEIEIGGTSSGRQFKNEDGVRHLTGVWKNGTLAVEHQGPRGGTMRQTYSLQDGGRTLVVCMERSGGPEFGKHDASHDRGSDGKATGDRGRHGTFTLVYRKVSA